MNRARVSTIGQPRKLKAPINFFFGQPTVSNSAMVEASNMAK